eukprot:COSAG04_NODE_3590_length_2686_cov_1.315810_2_plen_181_part_00
MRLLQPLLVAAVAGPAIDAGAQPEPRLRCPKTSLDADATAAWAAAAVNSTVDIGAVLRGEELDSEALSLSSAEQLHALGIPLGVALKLKRCFGSAALADGVAGDADGWQSLKVTAASPLVVSKSTQLPPTTAVTVTDGGTIHLVVRPAPSPPTPTPPHQCSVGSPRRGRMVAWDRAPRRC